MFKKINPRKVKIKITLTHHLSCQARINGVKATLLIDTGDANSCIARYQKNNFKILKQGEPFETVVDGEYTRKSL